MNLFTQNITVGATYACHTPWTNEMGYKWKVGEKVEVLAARDYSVVVKEPKQRQTFEILLEYFNNNFKCTTHNS